MNRAPLVLLLLAVSPLAAADIIYKCTDDSGSTLISNTKVDKSCKAVVTGPDNALPAPRPRASSIAASPSPAGFPKVAEDTQKARDGDRRRILEQELAAEQRGLDTAKKDLADQESAKVAGDQLLPYRDRVAQHERNIQAINRELMSSR